MPTRKNSSSKYVNLQTFTLAGVISIAVAIVGFMFQIDNHIEKRIEKSAPWNVAREGVVTRITNAEEDIDSIEGDVDKLDQELKSQKETINEVDKKVDGIKKDVEHIIKDGDRLQKNVENNNELIKEVLREVKKRN